MASSQVPRPNTLKLLQILVATAEVGGWQDGRGVSENFTAFIRRELAVPAWSCKITIFYLARELLP